MEIVCIRENGDVMELNFDLLGEFLFLDDGYVGCDKVEFDENEIGTYEIWKVKRSTTSVSRYDYEGNKVATYRTQIKKGRRNLTWNTFTPHLNAEEL